jgi:hypothetical protein
MSSPDDHTPMAHHDTYRLGGAKLRQKLIDILLKREEVTQPFIEKDHKANPYMEYVLKDVLGLLHTEASTTASHGEPTRTEYRFIGLPGINPDDI